MTLFLRNLVVSLITILIAGCKYSPNQVRSSLKSANIYQFVEEGTIKFTRTNDQKSGNLKFTLTANYQCAVIFWSEDLNENPAADSPMTFPCPKDETNVTVYFTELKPLVPYSFKIMIWPQKLTASSSAFIILRESKSLKELQTNILVINNYIAPRLSGETYVFAMKESKTLYDIQEQISDLYSDDIGKCQKSPPKKNFPFAYDSSSDQGSEDPFLSLSSLSTDGYSRGVAKRHKFYNNRYVTNMTTVDNNQKFNWFFSWQGQSHSFLTFPPIRFVEFMAKANNGPKNISFRSLKDAQPKFIFGRNPPEFSYSIVYPGHFYYIHLQLRNPFNTNEAIYCVYNANKTNFSIPPDIYQSLANGSYELTAIVESIQLHYKSDMAYPPWIITYQDMIHSKFEKVL